MTDWNAGMPHFMERSTGCILLPRPPRVNTKAGHAPCLALRQIRRAAASAICRPASAIRRKDGNLVAGGIGQRQLPQVVSLIERSGRARRFRIEVERGSQNGLVAGRVELQPTAASRRHEGLEAWRDAREVVSDARPELADAGIEGETHAGFSVVVENAEERGQR